jgi:hypothetical protein
MKQLLFFFLKLLSLHGCSEASCTLLVHFGSRSNTIDSKIQQLTRAYNIHNFVDIIVYVIALFLKVVWLFNVFSFRVAGRVYQSIHINIEIIDVGVGGIERLSVNLLGITQYLGISHTHPFEKNRNSHIIFIIK